MVGSEYEVFTKDVEQFFLIFLAKSVIFPDLLTAKLGYN